MIVLIYKNKEDWNKNNWNYSIHLNEYLRDEIVNFLNKILLNDKKFSEINNISLPERKVVICPQCKQEYRTRIDAKIKCCGIEL